MTRLSGHELVSEGAPHDDKGRRLGLYGYATAGEGRGKCTCRKLSPILPSGTQRKAWHREHKEEMRNA